MDAYETFRSLLSAIEIRPSKGRDNALYERLKTNLGITGTPAEFFASHHDVTPQEVLEAFLTTFEPFAQMVDEIYGTCAEAGKKADGGTEIEIRYDGTPGSLSFDPKNFLEYRRLRRAVRREGLWPYYHSDFVPTYSLWASSLGRSRSTQNAGTALPSLADVDALLRRAREVGKLHLEFLARPDVAELLADETFRQPYGPNPATPYYADSLARWRDMMAAGLRDIENVTARDVLGSPGAANAVQQLNRYLDEITRKGGTESWEDALEEWLRLPYWKKRWQVYQIWVTSVCIRAFVRAGGRTQSRIMLRTGVAPLPVAVLERAETPQLELWVELLLPPSLRADIAFVSRTDGASQFIGCIECKQRKADSLSAMVADVAHKYVPLLEGDAPLLLVNYDEFAPPTASDPRVIPADHVLPMGNGSRTLIEYIGRFVPMGDAMTYIVVDTTGSMHGELSAIASLVANSGLVGPMMLVLYGDHRDSYVAQRALVSSDPAEIGTAIENAPLTHGGDDDEALEDAMRLVHEDIATFARPASSVIVFTDAAAHPPSECPDGLDFTAEVDAILGAGGKFLFVLCGRATKESIRCPDRSGIVCRSFAASEASPLELRASGIPVR